MNSMPSQGDGEMGTSFRLHRGQHMLSLEQRAEGRRLAEECIRNQLATTPVDEDHAEALLWDAYAAAGLAPPQHIHWLDGPLELIAALGRDDEAVAVEEVFTERIAHCVWDDLLRERDEVMQLRTGAMESVDYHVRSVQLRAEKRIRAKFGFWWARGSLANSIWNLVASPVVERVKSNIGEALARVVSGSFAHLASGRPWNIDRIWASYEANHETYRTLSLCAYADAPLLAYLEYLHAYYAPNQAQALAQVSQLVSGYWLGRGVALLVRKPIVLALDEAGRLHNTLGPAIQYPDGWGFWARHGVHVPSWVLERPAEELTRDDFFAASNSEARRVIQERMGERFLWEVGARFIESGPRGVLYEVPLPGEDEEMARYVQVRDASTERIYYLRVPPTIQTAEAAVAWTFGLSVDEYDPAQES